MINYWLPQQRQQQQQNQVQHTTCLFHREIFGPVAPPPQTICWTYTHITHACANTHTEVGFFAAVWPFHNFVWHQIAKHMNIAVKFLRLLSRLLERKSFFVANNIFSYGIFRFFRFHFDGQYSIRENVWHSHRAKRAFFASLITHSVCERMQFYVWI